MTLEFKENPLAYAMLKDASKLTFKQRINNLVERTVDFPVQAVSQSSLSFQCLNLCDKTDARLRLITRFQVVATGQTVPASAYIAPAPPAPAYPAVFGTSPTLLSNDNSYFDAFCQSKMITEIKASLGGLNIQDTNRDAHLMDILTLQYNQKRLNNEFGIVLGEDIGLGLYGVSNIGYAIGTSALPDPDLHVFTYQNNNMKLIPANAIGCSSMSREWVVKRNNMYSRLISAVYSTTEAGTSIKTYYDENGSPYPTHNVGGTDQIYYTGSPYTLTQTNTYEIIEDIISPYLCNQYVSDHPYKVWDTSAGQALSFTLNLDQDYIKRMFKASNNSSTLSSLSYPQIVSSTLRLFTYNPVQLVNQNVYPDIVSYGYENLGVQQVALSTNYYDPTPAGSSNAKRLLFQYYNRTFLPEYFLIDTNAPLTDNGASIRQGADGFQSRLNGYQCWSNWLQGTIRNVEMTMGGTQWNILQGKTMQDLRRDTAEVLGNDMHFYKWMNSHVPSNIQKKIWDYSRSLGDASGKTTVSITGGGNTGYINFGRVSAGTSADVGKCELNMLGFLIIDMKKMSLGDVDGLPIMPCVQYGATTNINLSIAVDVDVMPIPNWQDNSAPTTPSVGGNPIKLNVNVWWMQKQLIHYTPNSVDVRYVIWSLEEFRNAYEAYQNIERREVSEHELLAGNWYGGKWYHDLRDKAIEINTRINPHLKKLAPLHNVFNWASQGSDYINNKFGKPAHMAIEDVASGYKSLMKPASGRKGKYQQL